MLQNLEGARAIAALNLQQLIAEYCAEFDATAGLESAPFFTEDCVLEVGSMAFTGHTAMRKFYEDLAEQVRQTCPDGARTTRHVFTNLRIAFESDDAATVDFTILNFSAAGKPPLFNATVPTVVSDVTCRCQRGGDGRWRIAHFGGAPIFLGDDPVQNKALVG